MYDVDTYEVKMEWTNEDNVKHMIGRIQAGEWDWMEMVV